MKDTTTRTYFIAQCCNKYVYEWVEPQFTSYMWYDTPTKFNTKEKCLQAVGSAMRNLEKPRDFDPFGQTGFGPLWLQYD